MPLKSIANRKSHARRTKAIGREATAPSGTVTALIPKPIDVDAFFKRLEAMPPLSKETIQAIEETVALRGKRPRRR